MDAGRVDAVWLMVVLLPGFFSVQIRDFFLPPRRATPMDRLFEVVAFALGNYVVAGALVFTALLVMGQPSLPDALARWSAPAWGLTLPVVVYVVSLTSMLLGGSVGWVVGHDLHYRVARRLGLTARSGRQDVWQDVFADHQGQWHVVHLQDGRVLVGIARYFSDRGERPSIFLSRASWIAMDGHRVPIVGSGILVTEAAEIHCVEFRTGSAS